MIHEPAVVGNEVRDESYRVALANDYRFYSYGDGMVIV